MERKSKFINKTLYHIESKNLIPLIWWGLVLAGFLVATMSLYPTMSKLLADMPSNMQPYVTGMENINTYFETQVGQIWALLVCIYGGYLAVKLVTKELKNNTYQVLYTTSISRTEIIRTKALRLFVNVTLLNLICMIASVISLSIWGNAVNYWNFVFYAFLVWAITIVLSFLVFGFALLFKKKFGAVVAMLIVMLLYFVSSFVLDPSLEWLNYFTPFSLTYGSVLTNGFSGVVLNGIPLVIWCAITVIFNVIGYFKFKKSDLC